MSQATHREAMSLTELIERPPLIHAGGTITWAPRPDLLRFLDIDGAHAFPIPFLDWYYTGPKLKPRGLAGRG